MVSVIVNCETCRKKWRDRQKDRQIQRNILEADRLTDSRKRKLEAYIQTDSVGFGQTVWELDRQKDRQTGRKSKRQARRQTDNRQIPWLLNM